MAFDCNKLFLNTILLGGSTQEKLLAASEAGFQEIELWQQDLVGMNNDTVQISKLLSQSNLSLTDYQVLLDFDGASEAHRSAKQNEALNMLKVAKEIGAHTILVPANTDPACVYDNIEADLIWLLNEAEKVNVRIAYEAMAWSTYINHTPKAWELIQKINAPNFGLVIDAFHIFALKRTVEDLFNIPMEKIYLVQLSDAVNVPLNKPDIKALARHHRLLPGEGQFPLDSLISYLNIHNYQGPIGLEVFNDDLKNKDPLLVAKKAMLSLSNILTI